jgi:hypothetical protein
MLRNNKISSCARGMRNYIKWLFKVVANCLFGSELLNTLRLNVIGRLAGDKLYFTFETCWLALYRPVSGKV